MKKIKTETHREIINEPFDACHICSFSKLFCLTFVLYFFLYISFNGFSFFMFVYKRRSRNCLSTVTIENKYLTFNRNTFYIKCYVNLLVLNFSNDI